MKLFNKLFVAFDEIVGAGEDGEGESEIESDEAENIYDIVL